jgi:hypothetical protein
LLDSGFAVASVGGHCLWCPAGPFDHAFDQRDKSRCVGGIAGEDIVVEDDAVVVVNHLGFVAERDRLPEFARRDRAGIGIMEADLPGCTVGDPACQSLSGLLNDLGRGSLRPPEFTWRTHLGGI